jgi:hypothetical protein
VRLKGSLIAVDRLDRLDRQKNEFFGLAI